MRIPPLYLASQIPTPTVLQTHRKGEPKVLHDSSTPKGDTSSDLSEDDLDRINEAAIRQYEDGDYIVTGSRIRPAVAVNPATV